MYGFSIVANVIHVNNIPPPPPPYKERKCRIGKQCPCDKLRGFFYILLLSPDEISSLAACLQINHY